LELQQNDRTTEEFPTRRRKFFSGKQAQRLPFKKAILLPRFAPFISGTYDEATRADPLFQKSWMT
jgi:hypothetical protein